MSDELKPCPFCGGTRLRINTDDIDGHIAYVSCMDCDDMRGPMSEFKYQVIQEAKADAIQQWNKRADDAELSRLRADQDDWRKGVDLIATALGQTGPGRLCCVSLTEKILALRADYANLLETLGSIASKLGITESKSDPKQLLSDNVLNHVDSLRADCKRKDEALRFCEQELPNVARRIGGNLSEKAFAVGLMDTMLRKLSAAISDK